MRPVPLLTILERFAKGWTFVTKSDAFAGYKPGDGLPSFVCLTLAGDPDQEVADVVWVLHPHERKLVTYEFKPGSRAVHTYTHGHSLVRFDENLVIPVCEMFEP
jgi:hypothetical protein